LTKLSTSEFGIENVYEVVQTGGAEKDKM